MAKFTVILEDGSVYKDVFIKTGKFFANTNSDIYWYLRENKEIEIIKEERTIPIKKDNIYYFTLSSNY